MAGAIKPIRAKIAATTAVLLAFMGGLLRVPCELL
jgi:hypothetical protein